MADHNIPLTTSDIMHVSSRITSRESKPTLRWAQRLIKKHNLSLKHPNIINHGRAIAASEEKFNQHFSLLKSLIDKHNFNETNIINMNETGWSRQQQKRQVIGRKGRLYHRPNQREVMTNNTLPLFTQ